MKKIIRLSGSELKKIIKESVGILKEEQSISHGTMRPHDVSTAILDFLKQNHPDVYEEFANAHPNMINALGDEQNQYWGSEECNYDLNDDLWDKMNNVAPEGEYFGSHPGDGSDYGFWKNVDEAVRRTLSKMLREDIGTGGGPARYFYEVYRLKGGGCINQSEELFDTPEEAREAGTRYAEKQPFPCKGIVFHEEGYPLGDESEYDEWTFYGGGGDYKPVYDYKRSEM